MKTTEIHSSLSELIGSMTEPVGVTFCDAPPTGIGRIESAAPAGCLYWKLAAEGKAFYTVREDHMNCPIGAYTHGAEITPDEGGQLEGLIGKMVGLQYLKMEDVPQIPHRRQPLRFVVYAPLSKVTGIPDVVLLRGNARQVMLLTEAANARSLMSSQPIMGRPACAVIAATLETGNAATSLGCVGNRVYTGLPDDEFYISIPGSSLSEILEALRTIVAANSELEQFHRGRCACA
jgi:uncharacterized protein (DUF169 family)